MSEPINKVPNKSMNAALLALLPGLLVALLGPLTGPGNAIQPGLGDLLNGSIGLVLLVGLPLIVLRRIKSRAKNGQAD